VNVPYRGSVRRGIGAALTVAAQAADIVVTLDHDLIVKLPAESRLSSSAIR
jgi:hypothetical protein